MERAHVGAFFHGGIPLGALLHALFFYARCHGKANPAATRGHVGEDVAQPRPTVPSGGKWHLQVAILTPGIFADSFDPGQHTW